MNFTTPDILTPLQLERLAADFAAVVGDVELGSVTVRFKSRAVPASVNVETGIQTESQTTYQIPGLVAPVEKDLGGGVQVGDVTVLVRVADLPVEPTAADVVEIPDVCNVTRAEKDPSGLIWLIHCGREGLAT